MIDVYHNTEHPLSLGELIDATEGARMAETSETRAVSQKAGLNVVAEQCPTEKVSELRKSSHSHTVRGRRARHAVVAFSRGSNLRILHIKRREGL